MNNGVADYYLWAEDFPDGNIIPQFTPPCGDTIFASDSNNFNGSVAMEVVEDETRNAYFSYSQSGSQYTHQSAISANWIVEGDIPDGLSLANFYAVTFADTTAVQNGIYRSVGQTTHDYSVMCNGGFFTLCGFPGTQEAHPGPISTDGNIFSVYWDHS